MNENLDLYSKYNLFTKNNASISYSTRRNYLSDVKQFVSWSNENNFSLVNPDINLIGNYKSFLKENVSLTSRDRHLSSLRSFFSFLSTENLISQNPFDKSFNDLEKPKDIFKINDFAYYLEKEGSSPLTIKNYRLDVIQFTSWLKIISSNQDNLNQNQNPLSTLNKQVIKTYATRLHDNLNLSDASIQRKLVSVRKYIEILNKYKLIHQKDIENIKIDENEEIDLTQSQYEDILLKSNIQRQEANYLNSLSLYAILHSKIGALGKILLINKYLIDGFLIAPIRYIGVYLDYLSWKITKKSIFIKSPEDSVETLTKLDKKILSGRLEDFYAPISYRIKKHAHLYSYYLFITRSRPNWYKAYHKNKLVHYLHFAVLLVVAGVMGNYAYNEIRNPDLSVLGTQIARQEDKSILFSGSLVDKNQKPITEMRAVTFAIYNSTSDKSPSLWKETQQITPDRNGSFTTSIGSVIPIPNSLFLKGDPIYLGIKIQDEEELKPRQEIPNVASAENANTVSGLSPITEDGSGTKNVLLALDSSGNLTIGPNGSTVFQTLGGTFGIKGQAVILETGPSSNGNIILSPDGLGRILVSKPIKNESDSGLGLVEIEDSLYVYATTSGNLSALNVYQNSTGSLISASSGSELRFLVNNTGEGYLSGGLTLNTGDLRTNSNVANIYNRFARIINLGTDAFSINIGSSSGTTTINNATLSVVGNQTIGGNTGTIYTGNNSGITFSGTGQHRLRALSGTLAVDSLLEINKDVDIVPQTKEGINDLGSKDLPFDNLYVDNIITNSINSQFPFWKQSGSNLYPESNSNNIIVGGNSDTSAVWKVFGQGANSGDVESVGNLYFKNGDTTINQLDNGNLIFRTSPNTSSNLATRMVLNNQGYLGLNNSDPEFRMHLSDDNPSTVSSMIENLSTSTDSDVLGLKVGNLNPTSSNNFVTFLNGNGEVVGKINGNSSQGVTYSTTGSDFAEYFLKNNPGELMTPGDLICLHEESGVTKCKENNSIIVGVVTDRAGFVGGSDRENNKDYILVGINGQIPVKVNSIDLKSSDPLGVSQTSGVSQKAENQTYILGRALEEPKYIDGVLMALAYIKPGWYQENKLELTEEGNLQLSLQSERETPPPPRKPQEIPNFIIYLESIIDYLKEAKINEILTEFKDKYFTYIENILTDTIVANNIFAQEISSPVAQVDMIRTNYLSPLSENSDIGIEFTDANITIKNRNQDNLVSFDTSGNASFSGSIQSEKIMTQDLSAQNATIAGALRVGRLIADSIEITGNQATAGSNQNSITYVNNYYAATESANSQTYTEDSEDDEDQSTINELASSSLNYEFDDLASSSSLFENNPDIKYNFASFENGLMALGPSSFSQVSVADFLSFNGKLLISDNYINSIDDVLYIQNLAKAGINILNGLVTIDTQGNLNVLGNATFAKNVSVGGSLSANLISPLPNQDLTFRLEDDSRNSFVIEGSTNSAVLEVNNSGDVVSSGSGNFLSIFAKDLRLVRGVQADTSSTVTVATASAGTAVIAQNQIQRTIISPYVTKDSLIYISPRSDTYGKTPFISQQLPTVFKTNSNEITQFGQFTIKITSPTPQNIDLNWWIIN